MIKGKDDPQQDALHPPSRRIGTAVIKWSQIAPYVNKVHIKFDPIDGRARGLKEFWRHTVSPKVIKVNSYEVDLDLDENLCDPHTNVTYIDGETQTVFAADKNIRDICEDLWDTVYDLQIKDDLAGVDRAVKS